MPCFPSAYTLDVDLVASRAHSSLQARMSKSWQNKSSLQPFLTDCPLLLLLLHLPLVTQQLLQPPWACRCSHALAVKFSRPGMPFLHLYPFYICWAPTHSLKRSQMPPLLGSLPKSLQLEFFTFSFSRPSVELIQHVRYSAWVCVISLTSVAIL